MSRNIDADKLIETIDCSANLGGTLGKVVECVKLYAKHMIASAPTVNAWIPCDEQLPEEDTAVLISYRYKDGEGDTSDVDIDITSYGQMYFGGNKVGNHKHWRAPFEYFESNYEVIAWMPLPEPWKGEAYDTQN